MHHPLVDQYPLLPEELIVLIQQREDLCIAISLVKSLSATSQQEKAVERE